MVSTTIIAFEFCQAVSKSDFVCGTGQMIFQPFALNLAFKIAMSTALAKMCMHAQQAVDFMLLAEMYKCTIMTKIQKLMWAVTRNINFNNNFSITSTECGGKLMLVLQ